MPRSDLPATVALRPRRSLHSLGPGGVVLGLDPATALVVDGLPPGLAGLVAELRGGIATAAFLDLAEQRGVARDHARTLLDTLHTAGELVDPGEWARVEAHRRTSRVVVAGTGPLTAAVVVGLVGAGIGHVYCQTSGLVAGQDLGTALGETDRGRPRLDAIAAAANRAVAGARVTAPHHVLVPDLVVLADEAPEPTAVAALHVYGTAHLPVRLRDGTGLVGPLVLPGRTACLACLDAQRSARDPGWPVVAAQIAGRRGTGDTATTAATAALATVQVLAAVDAGLGATGPPATLETTLEFDPVTATVTHRVWAPAAGCRCGAKPRPDGQAALDPDE